MAFWSILTGLMFLAYGFYLNVTNTKTRITAQFNKYSTHVSESELDGAGAMMIGGAFIVIGFLVVLFTKESESKKNHKK